MATIETIEARYNPEHDMIEAGPDVTWAEMVLVDEVKQLQARITELETVIAWLENNVRSLQRVVTEAVEPDPWACHNLLTAWIILTTPDREALDNVSPAEPILREADIVKLGKCVLAADREIKLLMEEVGRSVSIKLE